VNWSTVNGRLLAVRRVRPLAYGTAVILSIGALGAQQALDQVVHGNGFAALYPAVALAACLGGLRAGLLAALTCSVGAALMSSPRDHWHNLTWAPGSYAFVLFAVIAVLLAVAIGHLVRARDTHATIARRRPVLLQEAYHRVKNQLQSLAGMLRLKRRTVPDPTAARALDEAASQLMVMGRMYERLQLSPTDEVELGEYLEHICRDTAEIMAGSRVRVNVEVTPLRLTPERAATIALIANELVSNAVKHGFPGDTAGVVHVRLTREGNNAMLVVTDEGQGLPPGFKFSASKGLGSKIISALAGSLGASLGVSPEGGASFVLRIPL